MRDTLKEKPERFWYYNNGITIVCDRATRIQERGKDRLRIENPQIINGQQTTRVLAEVPSSSAVSCLGSLRSHETALRAKTSSRSFSETSLPQPIDRIQSRRRTSGQTTLSKLEWNENY
jgi:hypothetical protein